MPKASVLTYIFGFTLLLHIQFVSSQPSSNHPEGNVAPQDTLISYGSSHPIVFPYDLRSASKKYKLPDKVREISALSYLPKDTMAFVQDEAGKVYFFCKKEETIVHTFEFKKKGDFEGIEILGDTAYVLRSDGRIYEIMNSSDPNAEVTMYETFLTTDNDTEGLGYDPVTHSLLIACKGSPASNGQAYKGFRAIYAFDLHTKQLRPKPFLLIDRDAISKITANKNQEFQPSGIAIHPITADIYIIASVGQLLTVYSPQGNLKWAKKLNKDVFRHPEGICFSPKGNMYISNEGDKKKGNIIKITYQP